MTLSFTARLAWRNIWRQKRRTWVTASAVGMAMVLALFMRSIQEGTYTRNLDNSTRLYSGYIQLQEAGFAENKSIDFVLPADDSFVEKVRSVDGITHVVPRIESFALAAAGDQSKGVLVLGISPDQENDYSHLSKYINRRELLSVER
jgi:ABC-type lipoprotein release transport system permease subunit